MDRVYRFSPQPVESIPGESAYLYWFLLNKPDCCSVITSLFSYLIVVRKLRYTFIFFKQGKVLMLNKSFDESSGGFREVRN